MRTLLLILTFALSSFFNASGQTAVKKTATGSDRIYIPKDLEECFIQIDKLLPDSIRQSILTMTEDQFSAKMHMSLGMWMRNNWGLWKGSRLSKYFHEKGIYHPDDMSGIILDSYYRKLTGKEIELNEQIKHYQNYWKVVKKPTKDSFPEGVKKLDFKSGMYYDRKTNGQGYVHVGTSPQSSHIWLYDYYLGWTRVVESDIRRLEKNPDTREDILIEIYKGTRQ
jgi:hypothetical protein